MHKYSLIVALYAVAISANPVPPNKRQLGDVTSSLSIPTSIPTSIATAIPTTIPSLGGSDGGLSTTDLGGDSSSGLSARVLSYAEKLDDRSAQIDSGLGSSTIPGLGGSSGSDTGSGLTIPSGISGGLGGGSGTDSGSGTSIPSGISGLGDGTGEDSSLSSLGGSDTGIAKARAVNADCGSGVVLFARGTSETGTLGTIVGPKLQSALEADNIVVQGVSYAADAAGITEESSGATGGTGGAGTQAMVAALKALQTSCPGSPVVLSGYSQGAMLVHNTLNSVSASDMNVKAALTFGDPFKGTTPKGLSASTYKTYCASTDSVCNMSGSSAGDETGSDSAAGHLSYGSDADDAAKFVSGQVAA